MSMAVCPPFWPKGLEGREVRVGGDGRSGGGAGFGFGGLRARGWRLAPGGGVFSLGGGGCGVGSLRGRGWCLDPGGGVFPWGWGEVGFGVGVVGGLVVGFGEGFDDGRWSGGVVVAGAAGPDQVSGGGLGEFPAVVAEV